jgi:hypothetical protein
MASYGSRIEGVLSLTVGQGIWDPPNQQGNAWNLFTTIDQQVPGKAQVGSSRRPPNGISDFDYANANMVLSAADDWFNYPNLTGATKLVNQDTWGYYTQGPDGQDYQGAFLFWWMQHIPRAAGVSSGFHANWWEYVLDYDAAISSAPPPGGTPQWCNGTY